jgi:hypothetical protein
LSCVSSEEEDYRICQIKVLANMRLFNRDTEITQGLSEKLWNAHVRVMRFKAMGEKRGEHKVSVSILSFCLCIAWEIEGKREVIPAKV